MLDWETGAGNARFWTTKMLIDGLGNNPKAVMPSCRAQEQPSADVYIRGFRGGQLPGPSNHAVLVASMVNVTRSITLEGAGASTLIWMVAHRAAGHDNVSYSKGVLSGAEITLSYDLLLSSARSSSVRTLVSCAAYCARIRSMELRYVCCTCCA